MYTKDSVYFEQEIYIMTNQLRGHPPSKYLELGGVPGHCLASYYRFNSVYSYKT